MPVDRELFLEAGILRQPWHGTIPVIGDHLGHRVAFARVADGGRKIVGHGLAAKAAMQGEPAIDGTRHGDRQRPGRRDLLQAAALELGQGQRLRRAAGPVVAVQLLCLRVPDDGEQIATDAIAGRLHQAQRSIGGDGGIDRRAAGFHHVQCDLGGQWLRSGRHGVRRDDFRAGGEGVAGDAVGSEGKRGHGRQDGGSQQGTGKASGHSRVPMEGW